MKRILFLLFVTMVMLVTSCNNKFDDSSLWDSIHSLESRFSAMEAVMKAYENKLFIETVKQMDEGHLITFSDGSSVTIVNSEVETDVGKEDTTYINRIVIGENEVTFILTDGTSFSIPLYSMLSISFDANDPVIMEANSTIDLRYTINSILEDVTIEVVSSADIKAKVCSDANSKLKGYIRISSGEEINEYSKVVVLVSNGERVIMQSITFEVAGLEIVEGTNKTISWKGGDLVLEYLSNIECNAIIAESGKDWITSESVRALQKNAMQFSISENLGDARASSITICAVDGTLSLTYTIEQEANAAYAKQQEKEALVAFYNSLNGEDWTNSTNWCSDMPVSSWYGVTTDANGLVKGIHLSGNNLSGTIPKEMQLLTQLRGLCLDANSIASIPTWLHRLENLEYLRLESCGLSGTIPSAISQCKSLKYLSLAFNELTGSLPNSIGLMPNLTFLDLQNNNLTGKIPTSFETNQKFWANSWWQIIYGNAFDDVESVKINAPKIIVKDIHGNTINFEEEYSKNNFTLIYEYQIEMVEYDPNMNQLQYLVELIKTRYEGCGFQCIGISSGTSVFDYNHTGSIYGDILNFIEKNELNDWINIVNGGVDGENIVLAETELTYWDWGWPSGKYTQSWINPGVRDGGIFTTTLVDQNGSVVWSNCFPNLDVLFGNERSLLAQLDKYMGSNNEIDSNVTVVQEASSGRGVDLVVMGDAFSESSIASGWYKTILNKAIDAVFSCDVLKSLKDMFNIYIVDIVSENNGYTEGDSALGGNFGEGTHVTTIPALVMSHALTALKDEERLKDAIILVVMNSPTHDGTCSYCVDSNHNAIISIANCAINDAASQFSNTVLHEVGGHAIGLLADEYVLTANSNKTIDDSTIASYERAREMYGMYANIDFTNDPSKVLWKKFLEDERYVNEGLGVYEGAAYYGCGVWRPSPNSIMRDTSIPNSFNAPSREAIYKRVNSIYHGSSWHYDYETFVEWDVANCVTTE